MHDVPVYAVQLPPEAFDDTSGVRLETYLVQGLRWMIAAARKHRLRRLVVNISLGASAGPKDGTSFVEAQIKREVAKAKELTVTPVIAYGNDFRESLSAVLTPSPTGCSVGLRLSRNDLTASHVEFRPIPPHPMQIADLGIQLTSPDGQATAPVKVPVGQACDLTFAGMPIGRLYHVPPRPRPGGGMVAAFLMLSLAPTAQAPGPGRVPLAPAGDWLVTLASPFEGRQVSVQVQRDGSAVGYRSAGRQARLHDGGSHGRDPETRDYTCPTASAIRREGTNSALSTTPDALSVGAARVTFDTTGSPVFRPTRESAMGASWTGAMPVASAGASDGAATPGLRASGTLSGSTARLVGTSAAAALATRAEAVGMPFATPTQDPARLGRKTWYRR
jgi:hypothetical protein